MIGTPGIDAVLERLRSHLLAERENVARRVEQIKAAADAYLLAVEMDLAAALAARLGIESASGATAPDVLLALRAEVDGLAAEPQGQVVAQASPNSADGARTTTSGPVAVVALAAPVPAAVPVLPTRAELPEDVRAANAAADQALRALFSDFQGLDLDSPSNEVFRTIAEEYACSARDFQERAVPDLSDFVGRIVRKLTALSSQRGLRDIFGLKRAHHADWRARAAHARDERERLLAAPPRTIGSRIAIPESVRAAVSVDAAPTAPEEGEEEQEEVAELPLLRDLAESRSIVLMGGIVKNDKLTRLRAQLGKNVEWVATDAAGMKGIEAFEKRILNGRVGAVVILEELISHKHYEPVVAAARRAGVPIAYGAKAGKAAIAKALGEIEAALAVATG